MKNKLSRLKSKTLVFFNNTIDSIISPDTETVYLNSFPKSGNTWARFLLAQYFLGRVVKFPELKYVIPPESKVGRKVKKREILLKNPVILKSHDVYKKQHKKIIYLYRDPRDIIVSFFHFKKMHDSISRELEFETYFKDQVNSPNGDMENWKQHIKSYQNCSAKTLFLSYEEMLSDTEESLTKMLTFLEVDIDAQKVENAVKNSSFKKLKSDNESSFFRKGEQGDWKNYFSTEMEELFWNNYGKEMTDLGYVRH